eukprot:6970435-Karenia_brevis.AAC.1
MLLKKASDIIDTPKAKTKDTGGLSQDQQQPTFALSSSLQLGDPSGAGSKWEFVKGASTGDGKMEVHTLSATWNYQSAYRATCTASGQTSGASSEWEFVGG